MTFSAVYFLLWSRGNHQTVNFKASRLFILKFVHPGLGQKSQGFELWGKTMLLCHNAAGKHNHSLADINGWEIIKYEESNPAKSIMHIPCSIKHFLYQNKDYFPLPFREKKWCQSVCAVLQTSCMLSFMLNKEAYFFFKVLKKNTRSAPEVFILS